MKKIINSFETSLNSDIQPTPYWLCTPPWETTWETNLVDKHPETKPMPSSLLVPLPHPYQLCTPPWKLWRVLGKNTFNFTLPYYLLIALPSDQPCPYYKFPPYSFCSPSFFSKLSGLFRSAFPLDRTYPFCELSVRFMVCFKSDVRLLALPSFLPLSPATDQGRVPPPSIPRNGTIRDRVNWTNCFLYWSDGRWFWGGAWL